ncbi:MULTISPECIES: oligopeptidase A [unclassified Marinimicrobium]|jgi:oligopeptidase A|uniref:oligopeptidase A n=1 Tax=Marinimicrobium TaxID=359337 RepID=UPI000C5C4880|nr:MULTISPECIES: oligopeptidase A [unclassified Marinimicrobium]MAN53207.1 oligopeptidase A [Marinimicrobium sp.]|tara:strand:+ start:212 stop:2269 length:2058 start_codon:yes stop_codon:yes gene_type:complete
MANPLLETHELPPFSAIKPEHVEPAIRQLIDENRAHRERLLDGLDQPTWDNFVAPLEAEEDRLEQAWSPVSHLNAVVNSEALREAYNASVALLTEYNTEVSQDRRLYEAFQAIADSPEYDQLSQAQRQSIDYALRDFRLGGVALEGEAKKRYGQIKKRLSELSTQFANNVLDATQAWYKHFTDPQDLAGLPDSALEQAAQAAKQKDLEGYVTTLDIPSFLAVMTYAEDRALRRETYTAFVTRASAEGQKADGSSAAEWDNTAIIDETLALRHELAQLLGFNNYAERSLATKMADSTEQVINFLTELAEKSKPLAEQDVQQLKAFAEKEGCTDLQAWDLAYFSEKLRQADYALSQEELRPYFPAERVISGLFEVVKRLYDIDIVPVASFDSWHPDVRFYQIYKDGEHIAGFYFDIFARENKRGGAWMADCRVRRQTASGVQRPVAFLTCNFTPPVGETPSLLTHDEVTTLFHEFGHGLHHMLTQIDVAAVSGINGVAWDAVELPSQFLENWCWEPDVVPLISGHYKTGEPLPKDLLDKLLAAKNFQSGMQMVRQLEFSLFDFRLHAEYNPNSPKAPQQLLDEVRDQVAVITPPAFNKFQNSFSHIFAGGYAAGYYSYKWAEVLSADAFSRFEEEGIFNRDTGESFLKEILQQGGSRPPMELFVNFRGREPSIAPLLRHSGIDEEAA